jgi:hypothetical protein
MSQPSQKHSLGAQKQSFFARFLFAHTIPHHLQNLCVFFIMVSTLLFLCFLHYPDQARLPANVKLDVSHNLTTFPGRYGAKPPSIAHLHSAHTPQLALLENSQKRMLNQTHTQGR